MKLHIKILLAVLMLAGLAVTAVQPQEQAKPNADVKHFAKDGLSFDYPNGWDVSDQSTGQLQYLSLSRAGYAGIMVRAPRAGIDTKEKEDHAKQLIQEGFVQAWAKNFADSGAKAERSVVTTDVAGGPAEGTRLSARLDGEPGRVEIYWRLIGTRLVQLAIVGSDRDIKRSEPAWDVVRNSVKFETSPAPTPTPAKKNP